MKNLKFLVLFFALTFSAEVVSQPVIKRLFHPDREADLYDKLEVGLSIDATFVNPFDPEEIDIIATFISPLGHEWKVPGFYNGTR